MARKFYNVDLQKDLIAELQMKALELIQKNHLEQDYNVYCLSSTEKYKLIGFIVDYTETMYRMRGEENGN